MADSLACPVPQSVISDAASTAFPRAAPSPAGEPTSTSPVANGAEDPDALEAEDSAIDEIDDQISSYTASLASSAVDYPMEHGRRYHAFRPGAYFMPNDEHEMDRLDLSHATVLKLLGERLYLAPLEKDKVRNILDVGTGTGSWAMEMGDLFPNAQVYGNDLSPTQPGW